MMTTVIRFLVKVTSFYQDWYKPRAEYHQVFAHDMGSDPAMQVTAVKTNVWQETYKLETNASLTTRCINGENDCESLSIVIASMIHYLKLTPGFLLNITKLNMMPVLFMHSIHKTQR